MSTKTFAGNYFEDFSIGQQIRHATPRTVTEGDIALYTGLYGSRFAATSAATCRCPIVRPSARHTDCASGPTSADSRNA